MAPISQSPNVILTLILQNPNIILAPILQNPNIILTPILQNSNAILAPILQSPNFILTLILQNPNAILALILQSPKITLVKTITLCSKAQNYLLTKTDLHILKFLTHGKYKLLISQKYFFYKTYGNYAYSFHNQLTIEAHVYHP